MNKSQLRSERPNLLRRNATADADSYRKLSRSERAISAVASEAPSSGEYASKNVVTSAEISPFERIGPIRAYLNALEISITYC